MPPPAFRFLGYDGHMGLIQAILARVFPPQPEPLSELRAGVMATVRGVVVARDVMESPLNGDRCVYYSYTVEEWRESHVVGQVGEGFWRLVERDEAILEFYLQDGRDRAIVSPHRARVERGRGVSPEPIDLGSIRRRAQQLRLADGDTIEVTAMSERVDDLFDEDRAYRTSPARWILRAPRGEPIRIRLLARAPDEV